MRILEAGHAERRRIERDLHDSAQQRLVALRIHLELASGALDHEAGRETFERLGGEVEAAIDELREVAHGLHPQALAQAGVGPALKGVAIRAPNRIVVVDAMPRQSDPVETAMYFCCLECLQNAAKHAGHDATVIISLGQEDDRVSFAVEDDGAGFDPDTVPRGAGLTNLGDRLAAVGGTLRIEPARGAAPASRASSPPRPADSSLRDDASLRRRWDRRRMTAASTAKAKPNGKAALPASEPRPEQSAAAPSPFPPIADYAFLSDCHTGALVAPDGSIEWMCVPAFDAPSVFGALLDRQAGYFRFAPFGIVAPSERIYEPGTNVLVTTWKVPSGWLEVREALVMGPRRGEDTVTPHTRPPTDYDGEHMLVRTARCISGVVQLELVCEPCSTTAATPAEWKLEGDERHAAVAEGAGQRIAAQHGPAAGHRGRQRAGAPRDARRRGGVLRAVVGE